MKTEIPAISVIIPMYNEKKYIQQAVDSVLNQTFKDLNVIIVNDGSTDGCFELCQSLYGDNERVTLISNHKNMKFSFTENHGIREAIGKYIAFLDSDDVYMPNILDVFYNLAEQYSADVVSTWGCLFTKDEDIPRDFSGAVTIMPDGLPAREVEVFDLPGEPSDVSEKFREKLDAYLRGEFGWCMCWNKLYRRKFLIDNNILFPNHAADRGFTFQVMLHMKKYVKVPTLMNLFRNRLTSNSRRPPTREAIAKTPSDMAKFAADFERAMSEFDFFKDNSVYKYRIIELQLNALDIHSVMRYYPSGQMLNADIVKAIGEKSEEYFGEYAPFVDYLFHRYHLYYRQCMELTARIKQLESNK